MIEPDCSSQDSTDQPKMSNEEERSELERASQRDVVVDVAERVEMEMKAARAMRVMSPQADRNWWRVESRRRGSESYEGPASVGCHGTDTARSGHTLHSPYSPIPAMHALRSVHILPRTANACIASSLTLHCPSSSSPIAEERLGDREPREENR